MASRTAQGSEIEDPQDRVSPGAEGTMSVPESEERHLRVLIANERRDRLDLLAQVVAGLGHEVIAREIYVKEVGAVTERERPDVALVGLGLSSEHALDLITEIVREASCPVIALLTAKDPRTYGRPPSAASSPTSWTATLPSFRARSISPCNDLPSTRTSREPLAGGP
jgi:hypothetical protein